MQAPKQEDNKSKRIIKLKRNWVSGNLQQTKEEEDKLANVPPSQQPQTTAIKPPAMLPSPNVLPFTVPGSKPMPLSQPQVQSNPPMALSAPVALPSLEKTTPDKEETKSVKRKQTESDREKEQQPVLSEDEARKKRIADRKLAAQIADQEKLERRRAIEQGVAEKLVRQGEQLDPGKAEREALQREVADRVNQLKASIGKAHVIIEASAKGHYRDRGSNFRNDDEMLEVFERVFNSSNIVCNTLNNHITGLPGLRVGTDKENFVFSYDTSKNIILVHAGPASGTGQLSSQPDIKDVKQWLRQIK